MRLEEEMRSWRGERMEGSRGEGREYWERREEAARTGDVKEEGDRDHEGKIKNGREEMGIGGVGRGRDGAEGLRMPQVRHMGPMAQDFFTAFGLGEDPTRISSVDLDG
eukprot:758786-Hanusia_phi.AAC.4